MKDVSFVYDSCRALCRPQGPYHKAWTDSLIFNATNAEQIVAIANDAANKVHASLQAEVAKARSAPTALTKERDNRAAELGAARSRLAALQGQPAIIERRIADALTKGDTEAADEAEGELPSAQLAVEAARRRVEILAGLAEEAEQAVASEQTRTVAALYAKKRAYLQAAVDAAKAKLSRAVSECFPAVVIAEQALSGADPQYAPPRRRGIAGSAGRTA